MNFSKDLVRAATAIKELEIKYQREQIGIFCIPLRKVLKNHLTTLKTIRLTYLCGEDARGLVKLSRAGLQLEELGLDKLAQITCRRVYFRRGSWIVMVVGSYVSKLLRLQAPYLRRLTVHTELPTGPTAVHRKPLIIPQIVNLTELDVDKLNMPDSGHKLEIEPLSVCFPSLKKLTFGGHAHLKKTHINRVGEEMEDPLVHDGVRELTSVLSACKNVGGIEYLSKMYKFIVKLQIQLRSSSMLVSLWDKWPQLEILDIAIKYIVTSVSFDAIMTGIPAKAIKRINLEGNERPALKELKVNPGTADMKNLRVFRLSLLDSSENVHMTDMTGYYAFAVPDTKLREITICIPTRISEPCQTSIKEAMGIYSILELKENQL